MLVLNALLLKTYCFLKAEYGLKVQHLHMSQDTIQTQTGTQW